MFKFFKDWYNTHLTEPNQASFALIILFTIIILYVLIETVAPILVAVVLAYMLEGLVKRSLDYINLERKLVVILVYSLFILISVIILFLLLPLMLEQLSNLLKSLPSYLEYSIQQGKIIALGVFSSEQMNDFLSGLNAEMSSMG